jgi:ribosomal protein L19
MPSWMRKKQTAMYEAKGNVRPEKMDWKDRLPKPRFQIRILEQEEIARIHKEHPREVEEFRAGDKIKVTKYLSLQSDKTEVVRGMVLARNKGTRLNATFTLINRRLGDVFELTLPLHSPFITKIEVMDKRPDDPVFKRNKLYHVARMNPKVFQC